jgi:hypothetical protein
MLRKGIRAWLAALVAGGFGVGCGHGNVNRPFPPDPLLLSKHPVTGKADGSPSDQVAFTAPAPPPPPSTTVIAAEQKPDALHPTAVIPVSHTRPAAAQAVKAPALYDHAPDYTWLQGVLERRSNGVLYLRYGDPSTEDLWGGKVGLEFDTRLSHLPDGQRVHVEGELIPETEEAPRTNWNSYPQYRVRSVGLIPG